MVEINKLIPVQQLDGCINTISGKKFNLFEPTVDMIHITDIAKGLAYKPHFGGQTPRFFSVAEHSLLVRDLLRLHYQEKSKPKLELAALLHDGAEAYVGDMIKPLKVHMPDFCEVEDRILDVIFNHFDLKIDLKKDVKMYDLRAQDLEFECFYRGVMHPEIRFYSPEKAYILYGRELSVALRNYINEM